MFDNAFAFWNHTLRQSKESLLEFLLSVTRDLVAHSYPRRVLLEGELLRCLVSLQTQ
jgi:hypothetical protein